MLLDMRSVRRNPKFVAWIPVQQNYLENDVDLDPYRPYFGESKSEMDKAEEAYKNMLEDISRNDDGEFISDGEFDSQGELLPVDQEKFYTVRARKERASQRHTILETITRFGQQHHIITSLAMQLRISDTRRILHIYEVAVAREEKRKETFETRRKARERKHALFHAFDFPQPEKLPPSNVKWNDTAAMQSHFCFQCFVFCCEMHPEENHPPVRPIPDVTITERMDDLRIGRAKPCSSRCFLLEEHLQAPKSAQEGLPWTDEEIMVMRQGCLMTDEDPCSLAIIVGTKTCREVRARISKQEERVWIMEAISSAKLERKRAPNRRGGRKTNSAKTNSPLFKVRNWKGSNRPDRDDDSEEDDDDSSRDETGHAPFVPCNHTGVCTKANGCYCMQNNIRCESTCGCSTGRFTQIGRVIKWDQQQDGNQGRRTVTRCKNRHWGCSCRSGYCNTDSCECYRENLVCNPDFCNHCEANVLPQFIGVGERRCRNVDLITGRHKRTLVGKSDVHGFGLFALDHFEPGELIGHYAGRTVHAEKVDLVLRASDAKKLTYAFDLTHKMSIDGQCFGSKVRLINHSSNARDVSCAARFERVRGEGRIAIKAVRAVRPGEEFLFNYNITQGNEWLDKDSDGGSVKDSGLDDSPIGKYARESSIRTSSSPNRRDVRSLTLRDEELQRAGRVRGSPQDVYVVSRDTKVVTNPAPSKHDDTDTDSTMDCPVQSFAFSRYD